MFFSGQLFHLFALILLVSVANALAPDGGAWFQAAIWIAVVHQVYVWFGWRAQLMGKVLTRLAQGKVLGQPDSKPDDDSYQEQIGSKSCDAK